MQIILAIPSNEELQAYGGAEEVLLRDVSGVPLVIPPSPIKRQPSILVGGVAVTSQRSVDGAERWLAAHSGKLNGQNGRIHGNVRAADHFPLSSEVSFR